MARTILFAEDDRFLAELYSAGLDAEGFVVRVVHDGMAAILAAQSAPPDLALLDVQLPSLDGIMVLRALKADARSRRIPVVMFSNQDPDGPAAREAKRLGAAAYLVKAATPPRLLAEIIRLNFVDQRQHTGLDS